jgi:YfiH family protein
VSFGIGDRDAAVVKNRQRISDFFDGQPLVFVQQVHGIDVAVAALQEKNAAAGAFSSAGIADAMVTAVPGIYLVIQVADCQAVMIYDPKKGVIANIHAGWRGSARNIIGRTIEVMQERFDGCPADFRVGIGPSLGPCCAEFVNYRNEIPQCYWKFKDDAHCFDFWAVSSHQLQEAGVLLKHIDVAGVCTRCRPETFFSYRREKQTGRFAAAIGLS